MAEIKMCFGEVRTNESLPPLDTISKEVEKNGLIEQDGTLLGIQEGSDRDEHYVSDDYFFVRYVKEVSEKQPKIDRGKIQIGENTPARLMRFLLTQDGKYVCESTSQVEEKDVLNYLIGEHMAEIGFECDRKKQFGSERMEQFYNDAWKVRGLKLKRENGIVNNEDCDDNIEKHIKDVGNIAVRAEFSTGQHDKDLQHSDIIDGLVKAFDIYKVREKNESGNIHTIFHDGEYSIRYSPKLDIQQQSKKIYNILLSQINEFSQKTNGNQAEIHTFFT